MSATIEHPADWRWQLFAGTLTTAASAKATMEAALSLGTHPVEIGVVHPAAGQAPITHSKAKGAGAFGMFLVQTRRATPMVCPASMVEFDADIAGRFGNA